MTRPWNWSVNAAMKTRSPAAVTPGFVAAVVIIGTP